MYQHANKGQFPQKNFVLGVVESNLNRKSKKKKHFCEVRVCQRNS